MKSLRIYLFSLLSLLMLSPAIAQDDTERFMDRGREAYFDRDYDRAVSYFEEVAQIDAYYKDLYEFRGNAFFKLGEYREAELDYLEAIELLPKPDRGSSRRVGDDLVLLDPNGDEDLNQRYARLYNNLAVVRFKMGKRTAAEKAFETARNYDPDSEVIRDNERSADYDRSNELEIVDEATMNKRKKKGRDSRSDKTQRGYENEFNRRPVSLWEPSDRDAYSMMIDVRAAREEEVARDEMDDPDPKDENIFDRLLKPKVFIKRKVGKRGKTYKNPDFLGASQNYLDIERVVITDRSTFVRIKVSNASRDSHWVSLAPKSSSEAFKIVGRGSNRHKTYKLRNVKDMAFYPNTTELKPNGYQYFTLEFERIDDNIGFINIVEGKNQRNGAWNFYQIDLRR
ncbi:MAG: hypothetical protein AAGD28_11735 [Bacteroidota bacterium]